MVVVTRSLINGVDGSCKALEACQKLIEGHPIFVFEVCGRKVFP
jgi:hypothetical protein